MAKEMIMRVNSVQVLETRNAFFVYASGTVNSEGWTAPQLDWQAASDGIYEIRFMAEPPNGPATQALSPIHADYVAEFPPQGLKAIRVIASENSVVATPEFSE